MMKRFFCVGNYGHKRAEGTVAMRKEFFCVGNYGHKRAEGTVAMRKKFFCVGNYGHNSSNEEKVILCRQLRSHEG